MSAPTAWAGGCSTTRQPGDHARQREEPRAGLEPEASNQPLLIDGTLYVATHNSTVAVDAITGRQKWKVGVDLPNDIAGYLCCGIHTRGMAVLDGVLYRTTIDAHVLAISVADGKVLWKQKAADYKDGYSMTHAPLIAGGVLVNKSPFWAGVLSTASGLVFTGAQNGQFLAFDSKSGQQLWSFQTGSGISGLPIAWEKGGREYITVLSGSAHVYGALAGDPDTANVPAGGSVWTFALPQR